MVAIAIQYYYYYYFLKLSLDESFTQDHWNGLLNIKLKVSSVNHLEPFSHEIN